MISTFNHLTDFRPSDLPASEKLFLPLEDREGRTSFVLQDLGEYFLAVGFRDVFAQPIPSEFYHSELVTCVFLTVAALRINWAGVICARVAWSRFFEAGSTSAERFFLNNRTPISARCGQGVCGPVGSLFTLSLDRKPACDVDGGKPCLLIKFGNDFRSRRCR